MVSLSRFRAIQGAHFVNQQRIACCQQWCSNGDGIGHWLLVVWLQSLELLYPQMLRALHLVQENERRKSVPTSFPELFGLGALRQQAVESKSQIAFKHDLP